MHFLIFISVFLSAQALFSYYIQKRLVNKLDLHSKYKKIFRYFLILNFFSIVFYMGARYYPMIPNWLYFILSLSIGLTFVLFSLTFIYDLLSFALKKTPMQTSRRNFFKKSLDVSTIVIGTTLTAKSMYNAKHYIVEEIDVKIKDLKKEYTIVQLSDVHIGGLIDQAFIKTLVKKVNSLDADIVVITGDLVDTALKYAQSSLDELQYLKSKYGVYFISGNHEFYHNIDAILFSLENLGIKVLDNEHVYIGEKNQGFNLAGVHDVYGYKYGAYQPDINKALQGQKNSPTVLLAHQPRFIEEVPSSVALVLSGHTHGGQIIPFNFLVSLVQPYVRGLHQHNLSTQIYVNKGTGFWGPPMRLGASSEITHFHLKKA